MSARTAGAESVDDRPPILSAGLAVMAAVLSTLSALAGGSGAAVCLLGTALVATGVGSRRRWAVHAGTVGLVTGLLIAGVAGAPASLLLPGLAAAVLAWDLGQYSLELGEQVGRRAATTGAEVSHAAGSTLVAVLAVLTGILAPRAIEMGGTVTAAAFMLVAILLLGALFR
ncbi:MAG: hypothetical protein ABEJ08_00490 [Halobacteriaceae archaeon]